MKLIHSEIWGSIFSVIWERKYFIFGICVWSVDLFCELESQEYPPWEHNKLNSSEDT